MHLKKNHFSALSLSLVAISASIAIFAQSGPSAGTKITNTQLREINQIARPDQNRVVAIVGATLIDGRGGTPVIDSVVVVRGEKIVSVGKRNGITIPAR